MRLSGTKTSSVNQYNGLGDQLYDLGGARPTLDLNFSSNESLVDSVTGKTLVDHTRASNATYVDGDGIIKDAVTNYVRYSEEFDNGWTPGSAATVVTANAGTAPDGTVSADRLELAATAGTYLSRQALIDSVAGETYTFSFYAKNYSGQSYFDFYIQGGSHTAQKGKITATNEWVRYSFTWTATSSGYLVVGINNPPDNYTTDILIWGAQLEQSSTVGQYVKTTTAINSAPRFDHDPTTGESLGLLVEESRTNLVTYSEEFDNAIWGPARVTVSTESITSPAGDATVQKLKETATTGTHFTNQSLAVAASTVHTLSFFAKSAERTLIDVIAGQGTAYTARGFNLSTGVSVAPASTLPDAGTVNSSIIAYPNGWYRVSVTMTSTQANTVGTAQIRLRDGNSNSYTGDGTSGIYVWGAQLEAGSFATSYIPTEGSTVTRAADVASIEGRNFGSVNLVEYSEEFDNSYWSEINASVIPNQTTAPDGTLTADKIVDNTTTANHGINKAFTNFGQPVTYSVYAKAGEKTQVSIGSWDGSSGMDAYFDLTTGTVTSSNFTDSFIENVGNGWYRCRVSRTPAGNYNFAIYVVDSSGRNYAGDGTSGIYLWGAQLEEGSTATDYIKSDVNWTSRASNATYYDVNGTLKKSSYNELLYSQELDNAAWTNPGTFTWTPSTDLAPDGSLTVDKPSVVFTYWGFYDATNGAWLSGYPAAFPFTVTSSWTRQSVTITAPAGCTSLRFYPGRVGGAGSYFYQTVTVTPGTTYTASAYYKLDSASSTVLVWGAQLETGTYAGDYAKTEGSAASTARTAAYLPDGNGNFVSAGDLLLEESRTNLVTDSEDLTHPSFSLQHITVPFNSSVINPTGSTGSYKILADSGLSGGGQDGIRINKTASSANNIVVSAFVKKSTHRYVYIGFGGLLNSFTALFDIEPGLTSNRLLGQSGNGTFTNIDAGYQNLPNDWIRIWAVGTTTGTNGTTLGMSPDSTTFNITNWTAAGTEEIYAWGLQYEDNASYPTSYIPTSGSTATRAADVSTSAATFGNSWYEQDEGTVFSNCKQAQVNTVAGAIHYQFSDGTADERFEMFGRANGGTGVKVFDGGTEVTDLFPTLTGIAANTAIKIALALKENDLATKGFDDKSVQTDNSATLPTVDRLTIGSGLSPSLNGTISRFTYWPTRLSNDTLQTITV